MARKTQREVTTKACTVCMDNLAELDNGRFRRVGDLQLKVLLADIAERAEEDGKARQLMIEVEFIKIKGVLIITPRVKAKLPPYVCGSTSAAEKVNPDGELEVLFQPFNADNAAQPTFSDSDALDTNQQKGT